MSTGDAGGERKGEAPADRDLEPERTPQLPLPVRLFLIPAIIVVAVGIVLFLYRMLAGGESSPRELVDEIRSGSGHRRWQAAYELAQVLTRDDELARDPALARELGRLFEDSAGRDPRVRRYLALGLGRAQAKESLPGLIAALDDPDPETRVYAAWALGAIGDSLAAAPLAAQAGDSDPGMRKIVAYSLGSLGTASSRPTLHELLGDSVADVRWNAALALARLGDDSGRDILRQMIDREYLAGIPDMTPEQREAVIENGIEGVGLIGNGDFRLELDALAERDPSPNVRARADRARRAGTP
jgi:HEAT repeat protein